MSAALSESTRYLTPPTRLSGSQILTRLEIMRTRWRASPPSAFLSSLLLAPTDSYPEVCSRKGFVSSRTVLSFLPFPLLVGIYVSSHQVNLGSHLRIAFKHVPYCTTGVRYITMIAVENLAQLFNPITLFPCKKNCTLAC